MQRPLHLMYLPTPAPAIRAILERRLPPGWRLLALEREDQAERLRLLGEADALISGGRIMTQAELDAAPRLRVVQHQGVGYHDRIPVAGLKARGIRIAICPAGTAESVAELTLFLMLGALRRFVLADHLLRQGRFENHALRGDARLLHGRSVGLVGLGRIARHVMEVLRPFGVSGLYTAPRSRLSPEEEARLCFRYAPLEQLLAESDVVSLHVPATAETARLMDAAAIARMKPGAVLINTARGAVVDEAALVAALRSGHLSAAGLDVYETEPTPPDNPLLGMPNVVHTPHIGSGASDTVELKLAWCIANIERFFRDGTLAEEVER
ncbi:MAG: 2-hydroxyacid dehydrogenase [Acetobacteraceae bacterium]